MSQPTADAARDAAIQRYADDIARQTKSGPWDLTAEHIAFNKQCFAMLTDVVPIPDIHKTSDCDLIYRFLIAKRWNVKEAAEGIRKYIVFRAENKMDQILWEPFPEELEKLYRFMGVDLTGQPVGYNRPNPAFVSEMMQKYPRELIIRNQLKIIEMGRRICLGLGVDRITCITDMGLLGVSIVTNLKAMGLIKEMSTVVQTHFPENMRTMLVCNGGWTFSGVWAVIKPFLDERVQKKIQNIGSGAGMAAEIAKWIDLTQVPASYGGSGPEKMPKFRSVHELDAIAPGTKPSWAPGAYRGAQAFASLDECPASPSSPPATVVASPTSVVGSGGAAAAATADDDFL